MDELDTLLLHALAAAVRLFAEAAQTCGGSHAHRTIPPKITAQNTSHINRGHRLAARRGARTLNPPSRQTARAHYTLPRALLRAQTNRSSANCRQRSTGEPGEPRASLDRHRGDGDLRGQVPAGQPPAAQPADAALQDVLPCNPSSSAANSSHVMHRCPAEYRRGFSLIEVVIATILVAVLLSLLVPALSSARVVAQRDVCANNLRQLGVVMEGYIADHNGALPFVPAIPAWHYGGVRYSTADDSPFLDMGRPLSRWLARHEVEGDRVNLYCCPADFGIVTDLADRGAGRTCRAYGTSYRANPNLFDVREAGPSEEMRALYRHEITMPPSRLIVMGDPVWYEQYHDTGRDASWHGEEGHGNLLFLDGAVRFQAMRPKPAVGPAVIEPFVRDLSGRSHAHADEQGDGLTRLQHAEQDSHE